MYKNEKKDTLMKVMSSQDANSQNTTSAKRMRDTDTKIAHISDKQNPDQSNVSINQDLKHSDDEEEDVQMDKKVNDEDRQRLLSDNSSSVKVMFNNQGKEKRDVSKSQNFNQA